MKCKISLGRKEFGGKQIKMDLVRFETISFRIVSEKNVFMRRKTKGEIIAK